MFLLTGGIPKRCRPEKNMCFLVQIRQNVTFPLVRYALAYNGGKLWISVDTKIKYQNRDVD